METKEIFDPIRKLEGLVGRFIPPLPGTFILVSFQYAMLAIAFITLFMWVGNGFDSTLHFWAYEHNLASPFSSNPDIQYAIGIGVHWSTLFTIAFCAINLSLYLKTRLEIDGFINILYSLLIGWWVGMMVFEVPYVFLMEWFHNNPTEILQYPIWLAGHEVITHGAGGTTGSDATRWFVIASLLFPTEGMALYIGVINRYVVGMAESIGENKTKIFLYGSTLIVGLLLWFVTAQALSVSVYPVIIRNFTWLFGGILAHGLMVYEFNRPSRAGNPRKFTYRFKSKVSVGLLILIIGGWLAWIFYPYLPLPQSPIQKGFLFPQTVYAWYDDVYRIIIKQAWIQNGWIHFINVALKFLVAFWTCYVFAPKVASVTSESLHLPLERDKRGVMESQGETRTVHEEEPDFEGNVEITTRHGEVLMDRVDIDFEGFINVGLPPDIDKAIRDNIIHRKAGP